MGCLDTCLCNLTRRMDHFCRRNAFKIHKELLAGLKHAWDKKKFEEELNLILIILIKLILINNLIVIK